MHPRLDPARTAPRLRAAMTGLENYVHQSGRERSSSSSTCARLIDGCAYCADMHTKLPRFARRNRAAPVCRQSLARNAVLLGAVVAINAWNRFAVAFRTVPGRFQLGAAGTHAVDA
jgi:hypothetical protein